MLISGIITRLINVVRRRTVSKHYNQLDHFSRKKIQILYNSKAGSKNILNALHCESTKYLLHSSLTELDMINQSDISVKNNTLRIMELPSCDSCICVAVICKK